MYNGGQRAHFVVREEGIGCRKVHHAIREATDTAATAQGSVIDAHSLLFLILFEYYVVVGQRKCGARRIQTIRTSVVPARGNECACRKQC